MIQTAATANHRMCFTAACRCLRVGSGHRLPFCKKGALTSELRRHVSSSVPGILFYLCIYLSVATGPFGLPQPDHYSAAPPLGLFELHPQGFRRQLASPFQCGSVPRFLSLWAFTASYHTHYGVRTLALIAHKPRTVELLGGPGRIRTHCVSLCLFYRQVRLHHRRRRAIGIKGEN